MPNRTSQVQHAKIKEMLQRSEEMFKEEKTHRRRYPYEDQAQDLTERLNLLSRTPAKYRTLLESVRVLQKLDRAVKNKDVAAIARLLKVKKGMRFAYDYLIAAPLSDPPDEWDLRMHDDGLIVKPTTSEARAAMGALLLLRKGRIERVKQCLQCQAWFYARFRHQQFCPDPKKKCQWNHYHTPEWRRRHREQNKKHQRAYRAKLFGDRKHPK